MPVVLEVELQPFKIPDYVVPVMPAGKRQDGFPGTSNQGNFPLHAVPKAVLETLCEEFEEAVMKKAGYRE